MDRSYDLDVPSNLPPLGPSFTKDEPIGGRDGQFQAGMTAPSVTDDGWWLAHLWVADDGGIVQASNWHPWRGRRRAHPSPRSGRGWPGRSSGLIAEEDGRQLIRLRMPAAADETRPWQRPMLVMLAIRWDPVRATVMSRNQLAHELIVGFASAVEALAGPAETLVRRRTWTNSTARRALSALHWSTTRVLSGFLCHLFEHRHI